MRTKYQNLHGIEYEWLLSTSTARETILRVVEFGKRSAALMSLRHYEPDFIHNAPHESRPAPAKGSRCGGGHPEAGPVRDEEHDDCAECSQPIEFDLTECMGCGRDVHAACIENQDGCCFECQDFLRDTCREWSERDLSPVTMSAQEMRGARL